MSKSSNIGPSLFRLGADFMNCNNYLCNGPRGASAPQPG